MKLYVFKQRLQFKCKERNIGYTETDEAYTSKTCTKCGYLNDKLGGKKVFKCDFCKYKIDRDINGARNIMINSIEKRNIKKEYIKLKRKLTKIIKLSK